MVIQKEDQRQSEQLINWPLHNLGPYSLLTMMEMW